MPKLTDGVSNFAIGQCVTVTPLQIAGAVNAIVNDGIYIKPSLIEAIVDDDNNVIENIQNEENRIFSSTPFIFGATITNVYNLLSSSK